jgi:hypothetical protein
MAARYFSVTLYVSSCSQSQMKMHRTTLVWDDIARKYQFLNSFRPFPISMEQRVLIKHLWEDGHESTQIQSKLIEYYGTRRFLILMLAIKYGNFAWSEKGLKIQDAAEEGQIFKLVSESREHSKHRLTLQFETLLRLPALLCQRYSMSSLKFFI